VRFYAHETALWRMVDGVVKHVAHEHCRGYWEPTPRMRGVMVLLEQAVVLWERDLDERKALCG
jgi:hypothetical protein